MGEKNGLALLGDTRRCGTAAGAAEDQKVGKLCLEQTSAIKPAKSERILIICLISPGLIMRSQLSGNQEALLSDLKRAIQGTIRPFVLVISRAYGT